MMVDVEAARHTSKASFKEMGAAAAMVGDVLAAKAHRAY